MKEKNLIKKLIIIMKNWKDQQPKNDEKFNRERDRFNKEVMSKVEVKTYK